MKADEFDRLFDSGVDITAHLELSSTRRPGREPHAIQLDLPAWMIDSLDRQARRAGVTRQDLIKVWLAERLHRIA